MPVDRVIKRDGSIVPFDRERIENAIHAAARATGSVDGRPLAETLSWAVSGLLEGQFGGNGHLPHVEEVQDIVEEVLIKSGQPQIAKAYILYRQQRPAVTVGAHENMTFLVEDQFTVCIKARQHALFDEINVR